MIYCSCENAVCVKQRLRNSWISWTLDLSSFTSKHEYSRIKNHVMVLKLHFSLSFNCKITIKGGPDCCSSFSLDPPGHSAKKFMSSSKKEVMCIHDDRLIFSVGSDRRRIVVICGLLWPGYTLTQCYTKRTL